MPLCHTMSGKLNQPKGSVSLVNSVKAGPCLLLTSTLQQGQLLHEDFVMADWLSFLPSTKAKVNQDTTGVSFTPELGF